MTKKNMAHGLPKIFQQETLEIFKLTFYKLNYNLKYVSLI